MKFYLNLWILMINIEFIDSEIIATQPLPSDNEILSEVMDIDDQYRVY